MIPASSTWSFEGEVSFHTGAYLDLVPAEPKAKQAHDDEMEECDRDFTKAPYTACLGRIADTDADPGDSEDGGLTEPGDGAMPTLNRSSSGKRVGDAGVMNDPDARGKGFADGSLRITIDYALRVLRLDEVTVEMREANVEMRVYWLIRSSELGQRDLSLSTSGVSTLTDSEGRNGWGAK
ncbi:hypothetical protein HO133_006898 [Letharia lupina]|uniref:Uncharacterized protein n=1 Tax=Letharia lupina TaxID=560253 RepID=A0A8H6F7C1_9LECA|nr:uncharacterized protein HO133_006898 [Letharia lupina]KAF6217428.1 hypothetical protein HO133_006898 [Letharia lupina]